MTRIAYAGQDGAIYSVEPDGADPRSLAPPATESTWPTWSSDGSCIAFSGLRSGMNGLGHLAVYVKGPGDSEARAIYTNEPGTDAIARKTPHYALWSPDGGTLSFIAQTWRGGLTLFTHDLSTDGEALGLVSGSPLYMSWSADSRFLLAHSRDAHYLIDFKEGREALRMPGVSGLYMAPSWSPRAGRMALMQDASGGRQRLLVGSIDEGRTRTVAEIAGRAAFGWRPDGTGIGLARDLDAAPGYFGGLWLVDAESAEERRVADESLLCFFWSPDGSRVAYVTPSDNAEGSLRWAVVDVDGDGGPRYLADFRPTQEQLTAFMFFDQYGQSHSPWSPDGARIVFSGVLGLESVRTPLPDGSATGVFVVDVDGGGEPRQIGQGSIGVWSPA